MICVCVYIDNGMWMFRDLYEYYNGLLSILLKSFVICNLRILINNIIVVNGRCVSLYDCV